MSNEPPPDAPADLTVASYDCRLAELGAEQARLHREAADLRAAFYKEGAAARAPLDEARVATRFDRDRDFAIAAQLAALEEHLAERRRAVETEAGDLTMQAAQIGAQRNRVAAERVAIARLDAHDALYAATEQANAAIAAHAAAPAEDRAAHAAAVAAALRARRAAWLVWHLQFGGQHAPPLRPAPACAQDGMNDHLSNRGT